MSRSDLPVYEPDDDLDVGDGPTSSVRGILLAAGTSSRYGDRNKLLEAPDGVPLVRRAATTLLDSAVDGVTVVVGYEASAVRAALAGLDVAVCENERYDDGQSTSVRVGVSDAADRGADAALVALGDMPHVDRRTVDLLVAAYDRDVADIVAAAYEGQRGNPVLFDARFFDALTDVTGDEGGRRVLKDAESAVAVETNDPGVLYDVDRPSDLAR